MCVSFVCLSLDLHHEFNLSPNLTLCGPAATSLHATCLIKLVMLSKLDEALTGVHHTADIIATGSFVLYEKDVFMYVLQC